MSLQTKLRESLTGRRLVYQDEAQLQKLIADLFTEMGLIFVREFEFSPSDRIDFFMFGTGTGIEVKTQGSLHPILRQLHRYAQHEPVKELVLICPKPWSVPKTLYGKPVSCVPIFGSLL